MSLTLRRTPTAAALGIVVALCAGPAGGRELCRFDVADLEVKAEDTTAEGGLGVEIAVADGPLVLTRVALPAEEGAAGCWRLDLDGDGWFEVLIGLVQDAGRQVPRLVRFEWNGRLLESWPLPAIDPADGVGYAGGDTLSSNAGMLIRSFDVVVGGSPAPETHHFRYAPDTERWIRLQPLKRETAPAGTLAR